MSRSTPALCSGVLAIKKRIAIRFDDQTASTIFTIVDDDINNQLNIYYIILLKTKRKKGDLGRSGMNQYFIWLCYAIATTSADWS